MPNAEDSQKTRRRNKAKEEVPAPQFAEPGTPASTPEDRDLFADVTPEPEAVEEELAVAEAVLEERLDIAEPSEETLPDPVDIYGEPDEIAAAQQEAVVNFDKEEIQELLASIDEILQKHSQIATRNGFMGLASDMRTLRNAGAHVAKRIGDHSYLNKKG